MKKMIMAAVVIGLAGAVSAGVVYEATTANTTLFNNGFNESGTTTLSGTGSDLLMSNSSGLLNAAGFTSSQNVQALNGAALTADDEVVMKLTIDDITAGGIRGNGIEFGMAAGTGFRSGSSNLILALEAQNQGSDVLIQVTSFQNAGEVGFDLTEASLEDGLSVTFTANAAGYSFLLEDIVVDGGVNDGNTSALVTGTFAGTEFIDYFSGGFFYTGVQKDNSGALGVDYSEASISVVPEPATLGLVTAMGGGLLFFRRRFMI
ncbi:PEP-CTERM sorting domain-containing protein [Pontiellaceae bacterium B12219]|nr:PEP-CTERM sorting domain-containing protein [Pontiellaceae bacterium B12219]